MPELPDIETYLAALEPRIEGATLERLRLASPFLLRSVEPPVSAAEGKKVVARGRLGKRLVLELEEELFFVLHLMVAGRLQWKDRGKTPAKLPGRRGLAAFDFSTGTLLVTEAGTKKRASLYLVAGRKALAEHDPGGVELTDLTFEEFRARLRRDNHTLKRALTDPRIFSGIGNAYSDEILHRARLSPFLHSAKLGDEESRRLFDAIRETLQLWTERLIAETGDGFPKKVTAFRPEMAVHGRYREPCPVCSSPVQRIVYAANEANYCPTCQTGGRILADRALSRLLKKDWPRTLEELEERLPGRGPK